MFVSSWLKQNSEKLLHIFSFRVKHHKEHLHLINMCTFFMNRALHYSGAHTHLGAFIVNDGETHYTLIHTPWLVGFLNFDCKEIVKVDSGS